MDRPGSSRDAEEYIERHHGDASARALARKVGWSRAQVAAYLKRRGLERGSEDTGRGSDGGKDLPEFRPRSGRMETVPVGPRGILAALTLGTAVFIIYVLTFSRGIAGPEDAGAILDVQDSPWMAYLAGPWPSLSRGILAVPLGEPALRLHVLSGILGATAAALAFHLLRRSAISPAASAGAALAMAFSAPAWSGATLAGPGPLAAVLGLLSWLLFLRRRVGGGAIAMAGAWAALAFGALHLLCFPAVEWGTPLGDRVSRILAALRAGPSLPLAVGAAVGCIPFIRSAPRTFLPWAAVATASLLLAEGPLAAALLAVPLAVLLERAGRGRWAPATAGRALAALAGVGPLVLGFGDFDRRGDFVVHDWAASVVASVPPKARLHAAPDRVAPLRYFLEIKGERKDVVLERDARRPRAWDEALFIAGHQLPPSLAGRRSPWGMLWKAGGLPRPAAEDPRAAWAAVRFRNFDLEEPRGLVAAATPMNRPFLFDVAFFRIATGTGRSPDWIAAAENLAPGAAALQSLAGTLEAASAGDPLAASLYEAARSREPAFSAPRRALARIALGRKDLARARALIEEIRRGGEEGAPELYLLGEIAEAEGKTEEAVSSFREAMRKDPTDPRAPRKLGLICHAKGDREGAIEHLKRSLALLPDQEDLVLILTALDPDYRPVRGSLEPPLPYRPPSAFDLPGPRPPAPPFPGAPGAPGAATPGIPRPPQPGGSSFPVSPFPGRR